MAEDKFLNKSQKEGIMHGEGPLLIIAGAGSGKTTVVVERIKHLILEKKIPPSQILGLTFTEKAAAEMEERVDVALPLGYSQMWISTFHSFCDRILRDDALQIGLDNRYRLMSEAEATRFMRQHLFEFELSYFRPLGNPTKFLSGLREHFARLADEDISPSEYSKWATSYKLKAKSSLEAEKWRELAGAYQKYEELKTKEGKMDFSDLITNTLKLFRERPNVLQEYKKQFKYILVDEFQDTNIAQYNLIKLLAPHIKKSNLTAVGDDSQSIYKFRGAAISNILNFMQDYKDAKTVVLTANYRSTQNILDASYRLIQHNNPDTLETRLGIDKNLVSVRKEKKENDVEFIHADRVENEADIVSRKIAQLAQGGRAYSDFAILVRANNHSEPFARALSRHGIPYQFLGPGQLFHQEEIKELISYLKVLYDFSDSQALYKVLSMEALAILPQDLAKIISYARRLNLSLFEACEKAQEAGLSADSQEKISRLIQIINKHLSLVPKETAGQILYYFLESTGILGNLIKPEDSQTEKRAQNIAKFFDRLKTYEVEHEDVGVYPVVDWIDLSLELGESPRASDFDWQRENAVNILTVHSSKGLEFPVVFVVNLVSERFPTRERHEQIPIPEELIKEVLPEGDYHQQEERRLAYVAMTRARDLLFLTAADYYGEGKREKKISPFVAEALGEEIAKEDRIMSQQLSILDYAPIQQSDSSLPTRSPYPITHLSYSQIDTFSFCPLHYKLRYVLKVPTPPAPAQSFGITLHETLKMFYQRIKKDAKGTLDELLSIYEENWIPLGFLSKEHAQKMKKRGQDYLTAYLKSEMHNLKNLPIALEKDFVFPVGKTLKIRGRLDRVDKTESGIEIIDYKTGEFYNKELPGERELARDLQLSVYALAGESNFDPVFARNKGDVKLSLYFLDKQKKVSTTRSVEQLKSAKKELLDWKKKIEESDFSCSGNFWCRDCEYKLFCKAK